MCYELRFFKSRAKSKAQVREETPERQRARADVQPARSKPKREVSRERKVERVFEDVN